MKQDITMGVSAALRHDQNSIIETYDTSGDRHARAVLRAPDNRQELDKFVSGSISSATRIAMYIVRDKKK